MARDKGKERPGSGTTPSRNSPTGASESTTSLSRARLWARTISRGRRPWPSTGWRTGSNLYPRYNPREGVGEVEASVAKILVVDDEPNIREVVGLYLRRDGHDVVSAADGEEALAVFRESEPDLVVYNLMLPKMSGLEVCGRMEENRMWLRRHSSV